MGEGFRQMGCRGYATRRREAQAARLSM